MKHDRGPRHTTCYCLPGPLPEQDYPFSGFRCIKCGRSVRWPGKPRPQQGVFAEAERLARQ